jgi:hypothetical protein
MFCTPLVESNTVSEDEYPLSFLLLTLSAATPSNSSRTTKALRAGLKVKLVAGVVGAVEEAMM